MENLGPYCREGRPHLTDKLLPDEIMPHAQHPRQVLGLGASGYVGGRLVPRPIQAGHTVSVAVCSTDKLEAVP